MQIQMTVGDVLTLTMASPFPPPTSSDPAVASVSAPDANFQVRVTALSVGSAFVSGVVYQGAWGVNVTVVA